MEIQARSFDSVDDREAWACVETRNRPQTPYPTPGGYEKVSDEKNIPCASSRSIWEVLFFSLDRECAQ